MGGTISVGDAAILRQYPHTLKRYLAFAPRTVVYTAQVNGDPLQDADSGGIYAIPYDNGVGNLAEVLLDYTIDIGTTPGDFDVGQFRVRKTTDGSYFYVNETAFSTVPVADNHYITVVAEHRIWQRRIRRKYIDVIPPTYEEYFDYDIAYGGENDQFYPPIANVTRDTGGNPYIPAGFTDEGETYRTVDLSAALSLSPVNPITLKQWNIADGTLVAGTLTSDTIQVQFPVGYREVRLSVLTAYGISQPRYVSIWVFPRNDPGNAPLTNFSVTSDQRGEGREMGFLVRADVDLSIYPKGALACYWEEAEFGGSPAPDQYIRSFIGWATQDVVTLRLFRSLYSVKVGGPQTWLNTMYGYAQTVYDPQSADTLYIHMPNNTPDKMAHYFLRIYTTALQVMNLYFSDYDAPIEGYTSNNGSVWSQIVDVCKRYFGVAACDSIGSLYLGQHRSYLTQTERDALPTILNLQKGDWPDDKAPELAADRVEKYGLVDLYGSNYDIVASVDYSHVWRVWSPGLVQGVGTQQESGLPSIFLEPTEFGLTQLRRLAGYHLARLNNPRSDNSITLKGNFDVFEVAWGLPITITYTDDNVRGESLNAVEFLIKGISVSHSEKAPYKTITLSLEQAMSGLLGVDIEDVLQRTDVEEPRLYNPLEDLLRVGHDKIAAVLSNGLLIRTANFTAASPNWTVIDLGTGSVYDVLQSPFDLTTLPVVTGDKIFRVTNIHTTPVVAEVFTFRASSALHSIQYERGQDGFAVVVTNYADGVYVTRTLDGGLTWSAEILVGAAVDQTYAGWVRGAVEINPHSGAVYVAAHDGSAYRLYKSSDSAASFAVTADYVYPGTGGCALLGAFVLHIPWDDPTLLYHGHPDCNFPANGDGASAEMMKSTVSTSSIVDVKWGPDPFPRWAAPVEARWGMKSFDGDADQMLMVTQQPKTFGDRNGLYRSLDGWATMDTIIDAASASGDLYRGCAIGDDGIATYLWGSVGSGGIWYAEPFATFVYGDLVSKKGDLSAAYDSDYVLNIFGLPE